MKLSLIIQAIDRATAPLRKVTGAMRDVAGKGLTAITRAAGNTDRALAKVGNQRFVGLRSSLSKLGNVSFKLAELGAYKLGAAVGSTIRKVAKLGVGLAALAAGSAVYAGGRMIGDIIGIASKFEQFQVILENTEGSADKAKKAMDWVTNFAKTTPYEIGEVMDAFVKMRAYGIDPTQGALTSLGNAASGMGKDLMSAIEMIADAQTGEFERLKEFGIKAKQAGNQVTYSWSKNGKDMTRTSTKAAADIRRVITGIFDENFGGMMDRQSRTFAGLWSNLKDSFSNFELAIANAGVFDFLKAKLTEMLGWVNKAASDGRLKQWAEEIGAKLKAMGERAWEFIEKTDWNQVGADLRVVVSAAADIAKAIADAVRWGQQLNGMIPNWAKSIIPGGGRFMLGPAGDAVGAMYDSFNRPKPSSASPAGRPMWPGQGPMKPGAKPLSVPSGAWGKSQVGGKVSLEIRTQPGTTAVVKSAQATNPRVPIEVNTGRVRTAA